MYFTLLTANVIEMSSENRVWNTSMKIVVLQALLIPEIADNISRYHRSLVVRKPAFCIWEADPRLCFRYIDSTIIIPLFPKYKF